MFDFSADIRRLIDTTNAVEGYQHIVHPMWYTLADGLHRRIGQAQTHGVSQQYPPQPGDHQPGA